MSPKANSPLKLMTGHPDPSLVESVSADDGSGSISFPHATEMARWRRQAAAQLESELAQFDMNIISGQEPARAAHTLCHGFMDWTRNSLATFGSRPTSEAQRSDWSRERAVWIGLADLASQDAANDPSSVDRFLQIWLGVVHEASATGRAWMFAR